MPDLTFDDLKDKERRLRGGFPATMGLRVHRAISWIGRAQNETADPDAAFVFFWIAFNAAYADEKDVDLPVGERQQFGDLLRRIVALDRIERLHAAVANRFQGPIGFVAQIP